MPSREGQLAWAGVGFDGQVHAQQTVDDSQAALEISTRSPYVPAQHMALSAIFPNMSSHPKSRDPRLKAPPWMK
jgi:hypothetical protein